MALGVLLVLLFAVTITAAYGFTVERIAYKRLRRSTRLAPLIIGDRRVDLPAELRAAAAGCAGEIAAAGHQRRRSRSAPIPPGSAVTISYLQDAGDGADAWH